MIVLALIVYCRSRSKQLYVSMTRKMHQNELGNLLVYSCLMNIMAGIRGVFRGFVKGQHMYNTFYSQTLKLGSFEFLEASDRTIVRQDDLFKGKLYDTCF